MKPEGILAILPESEYFCGCWIYLGYFARLLSEIMDLSWLLCQPTYLELWIFLGFIARLSNWIDRYIIILNIFPS